MDRNRRLPANPEVPAATVIENMSQMDLRKTCSKFGIALSFKSRRTGGQEMISSKVLRERLNQLRDGYLKAFAMDSDTMGAMEQEGMDPKGQTDPQEGQGETKDVPPPPAPKEEEVPPLPKEESKEVPKPAEETPKAQEEPPKVPAGVKMYEPDPDDPDEIAKLIASKLKAAGSGIKEEKVREIATSVASTIVSKAIGEASKVFMSQINAAVQKAIAEIPGRKVEIFHPDDSSVKLDRAHSQFPAILDLLQDGNTLMVGPAGCGKSTIGRNCAEALKLGFFYITMNLEMTKGDLLGRKDPRTGEWEDSPLTTCAESGGVILIDEIDGSDGNTLLCLNALLDTKDWFIPRRAHKPRFTVHDDFHCLAAANTFGTGANRVYAGRNQLDAATLDRFVANRVEVDYDKELERELCEPEVLKWGWKVREAIRQFDLRRIMSTRTLVKFSNQVRTKRKDGSKVFAFEDCKKRYFSDWSIDDRKKVPL